MSKPRTPEARLRENFRKYIGVAEEITQDKAMLAFDLAVQKDKLTNLEAELLRPKPVEKSKIDVSGERLFVAAKALASVRDIVKNYDSEFTLCILEIVEDALVEIDCKG